MGLVIGEDRWPTRWMDLVHRSASVCRDFVTGNNTQGSGDVRSKQGENLVPDVADPVQAGIVTRHNWARRYAQVPATGGAVAYPELEAFGVAATRSSSLGHSVIARHGITGNVKATAGPCLPITDTGTSDKSLGRMIHRTRLFSTKVASSWLQAPNEG